MGDDTCFSLAFSVPAVLMFISICMGNCDFIFKVCCRSLTLCFQSASGLEDHGIREIFQTETLSHYSLNALG